MVCKFIGLRFNKTMLRYHERAEDRLQEIAKELPASEGVGELGAEERIAAHSLLSEPPVADRVEAWRTEMSPEDNEAFERASGDLLAELGYPLVSDAIPGEDAARVATSPDEDD